MPTTYTPNASNDPATYTLPSDLDNATAESVNVAFRALADKAAHAYSVFAQLALSNTFADTVKVNPPTSFGAGVEVLGNGPWRLMWIGHTGVTDGTEECEVRMHVNNPTAGGGPYFGALTINAYWTGSDWRQQCNTQNSTAILFRGTGFDFAFKAAGSADWATWPQGTSEAWFSSVYATSNFLYSVNKTRTMYLTPAQARGAGGIESGFGDLTTNAGDYAWWRIQLPVGAVVTRVDIKHSQATSTAERFDLVTRDPKFSAPTTSPSWSLISGASANIDMATGSAIDGTTGYKTTSIVHSVVISAATELYMLWRPIDSASVFSSARVTWSDPGPGRDY